ncbi:AAA family ATPase [Leptolyngbya sp. FACHB-261]|uniref:AAA family ATPase n=1 Tax=Leptolyngbya sp. FACHB-261 TaxID=2692806 RepID=UPI0016860599|nr:AAA family ATPase [Leptolyngbya sp. FACHB-261]MBD2104458.1 hypothetical protein [Leptolyngbya sp. FACHB-261]
MRWHSAFWDELQRLPLLGLDQYVVLVAERNPVEGQAAIKYLSNGYQRWAAQAAQIELDARHLHRHFNVAAISQAHRSLTAGELEGPASVLLRSFSRISQDVEAALRQGSIYNQRLALSSVADRLDGLLRELIQSSNKYAVRFHPIANHWHSLIQNYIQELTATAEQQQEIDSPYIIGVPLTEQQRIFTGRTDVSSRIEQLLLDRRRPPLLLYGQRRMGKTSLLNNLGRLLPNTIIPLFVDLQGPASRASDQAGFLYNLARGMTDSAKRQSGLALPALTREALEADAFTCFDEWLDQVEQVLGQNTALLSLDEFEVLDHALDKGRFNEADVLGLLRNLIQHRPRFKILISGSHTLEEFQRWASYLINVQVVHISYLKEDETRKLVEQPVKDFALRYELDASRRVLDLTRGHPFLVQLLCAEIVALKNEQDPSVRRLAQLDDVEAAIPEALDSSSLFFADIRNQVDKDGLALLRFLAAKGERASVSRETLEQQLPDNLDNTLNLLLRRELIEATDKGYRFQVELIRHWFARGS